MSRGLDPLQNLAGIGADEAGRGPLAGPVVAAAVCVTEGFDCRGIRDSKKLSREQREGLRDRIQAECAHVIVEVPPSEIDQLNILWATMVALRDAINRLSILLPPGQLLHAYVDGNRIPKGLTIDAEAVVKGDDKIVSIAAASILAKTHRDALMVQAAQTYPEYGFDRHFGYPTPEHLQTLRRLGPCAIHRRSFAPVAEVSQTCLELID